MTDSRARILNSLDSLEFAPLVLKSNAIDGTEPLDAIFSSFVSAASNVDLGFWECSPGRFRTSRDGVHEVVLILEGSATLIGDDGERLEHAKGDLVLLPNGWSGVWEIHEHFKKLYLTITL